MKIRRSSLLPVVFIGATALAMGLTCRHIYLHQARSLSEGKYETLKAISASKAEEITAWRIERLNDAGLHAELLTTYLHAWMRATEERDIPQDVLCNILVNLRHFYRYQNAFLVDTEGVALFSAAEMQPTEACRETPELARRALSATGAIFGDIFRCADCGNLHIDTASRILDENGDPAAVLVLRSDPETTLFRTIQSQPTPSETAETLLLMPTADGVLIMNTLRHDDAPPMSLHVSQDSARPFVNAALGRAGRFTGMDYRGTQVLASIRPLPGTPWIIVSKIDTAELLAAIHWYQAMLALLLLLILLLAIIMVGWLHKNKGKRLFERMYQTERQQREMLEEFRTTLYSIGDAVITTDVGACITRMNRLGEELTGWPEEEAIGQPITDVFRIVNETSRAIVECPVRRVLREHRVVGLANHTLLIARDGTERPIADSGAPIRDEDGEISGVILVFRDQTLERNAQRELEESRKLLQEVLDTIPVRVFWKDMNFNYLGCNASFARDAGFEGAEEIAGLSDRHMPWKNEAHIYRADDQKVLAGGVPILGIDEPQTTPEGLRWVRTNKAPLVDTDGHVFGVLGTYEDITGQREQAERLRRTEQRLRSMVVHSPDGMLFENNAREIVLTNQTFCDLFQIALPPDTLEGWNCARAAEDSKHLFTDPDPFVARIEEVILKRELVSKEELQMTDGTILERDYIPIRIENQYLGHVWIYHDVTDRRALEEQFRQAQKMEAIGRLAGGVAHDFNNMLEVIIGHSELAMDQLSPTDLAYQDLTEILKASKRSADLTRQLLAFARRQTVSPEVLDLNKIVGGMLKMLNRLIGENITLHWNPGEPLDPVKMDPAQIDQIMANLVVNARDAILVTGTVTIATHNERIDSTSDNAPAGLAPGHYVVLSVTDDGHGIEVAHIEQIFEPFFTTKEKGKGTGLGLATVYGIVRQSDGVIRVQSKPGEGTSFTIYLPCVKEERPAPAAPKGNLHAHGTETILFVEDEEAILQLGRRALEKYGYAVLAAQSPDCALELAQHHEGTIDLLLSDMVMPGMNGKELSHRITTLRPGVKTLYMSGYTANIIVHNGGVLDAGINFLQKPFSTRALAERVRAVLDS